MSGQSPMAEQLEVAWQRLALRWEEAAQVWNDEVRRQFEEHYWSTLKQETGAVHAELAKLAQVLAAAQRSVK